MCVFLQLIFEIQNKRSALLQDFIFILWHITERKQWIWHTVAATSSFPDIQQPYHIALGEETGKSRNTQLELLVSSESGGLPPRMMKILHSSCGAGSTCKQLGGKRFTPTHSKQGDVISRYWCLVRQKPQSNLDFNLEEEMVRELTHNRKTGMGSNNNPNGVIWEEGRKTNLCLPTEERKS